MTFRRFDQNKLTVCDEGTEHALMPEPFKREFKADWDLILEAYAKLEPGQGVLSNDTLNLARRDVVAKLARRGLTLDTDYQLYSAKIDAVGARLPKGNWMQYIKRLSTELPTL